jgi:hypothetical protein
MRLFVVLACLIIGPLGMPAGPSDTTASRIPDRQPVVPQNRQQPLVVGEDQLKILIGKWQARLGLIDWTIEGKVVRSWELPQGAVANIHWSLPKRKATLRVLSSVDYNLGKSEIPRDTELSVVHELIHLSMAKLPLDPDHTETEEDTVKKISTALLDLEDSHPGH